MESALNPELRVAIMSDGACRDLYRGALGGHRIIVSGLGGMKLETYLTFLLHEIHLGESGAGLDRYRPHLVLYVNHLSIVRKYSVGLHLQIFERPGRPREDTPFFLDYWWKKPVEQRSTEWSKKDPPLVEEIYMRIRNLLCFFREEEMEGWLRIMTPSGWTLPAQIA